MSLAVFLLQRYSPITHSFLPFPVRPFFHCFLFFVSLLRYYWWQWCLYWSLRVCAKLFFPPQLQPPMIFKEEKSFTLAEAPACGSTLYFFWMKGLNESAFLFPLWGSWAAGCLRVHVSRPTLGCSNNIRLDLRTRHETQEVGRGCEAFMITFGQNLTVTPVLLSFSLAILRNKKRE